MDKKGTHTISCACSVLLASSTKCEWFILLKQGYVYFKIVGEMSVSLSRNAGGSGRLVTVLCG